jgi:hypothetical protein
MGIPPVKKNFHSSVIVTDGNLYPEAGESPTYNEFQQRHNHTIVQ